MGSLNCPTCGAPLSEADKTTGPEAPEVGWEYYECPDCGARNRPDVVDPTVTEDDTSSTNKTQFTGTAVQVSTPVILDDGDTTIECRGLDAAEVQLGEQVTVTGFERTNQSPDDEYAKDVLTNCSRVEET